MLGPVFRAFDSDRDRLVAIKLFRLDLPPDRMHQLVARIEQLIAADLDRPGVVAPVATGTDGIVVYAAQDFISADSLDVVMRDEARRSVAGALDVVDQLAGALDAVAAAGVEHGALHPRDVLLAQDRAWLTGCGIARAIEAVGVTPPVRRPYTAPERIAGDRWDRRADIFSLAAIAHEMLWGRRVAGGGVEAAERLTALPGADLAALQLVFAKALAEAASDRFGTAREFSTALAAALRGAFASPERAADVPRDRAIEPAATPLEHAVAADAPAVADGDLPLGDTVPAAMASTIPEWRFSTGDQELASGDEQSTARASRQVADTPIAGHFPREGAASAPSDFELHPTGDTDEHRDPAMAAAIAPAPMQSRETLADPKASLEQPPARGAAPRFGAYPPDADVPSSFSAASRSGIAAVIAALAVGFGAGYLVGGHQSSTPASSPVNAVAPTAASATSGVREGEQPARTDASRPSAPAVAAPRTADAAPRTADAAPNRDTQPALPRGTIAAGGSNAAGARRTAAPNAVSPVQSAPVTGGLEVASRPAGARVFLDGKFVGRTPVALTTVSAGEHAIRLRRAGYRQWSSLVRVASGSRQRVTASMER